MIFEGFVFKLCKTFFFSFWLEFEVKLLVINQRISGCKYFMSPDVSVIYCSVTNCHKFPHVNNNNSFTQKFHLGQESVEANHVVSQGVT